LAPFLAFWCAYFRGPWCSHLYLLNSMDSFEMVLFCPPLHLIGLTLKCFLFDSICSIPSVFGNRFPIPLYAGAHKGFLSALFHLALYTHSLPESTIILKTLIHIYQQMTPYH
jgi:hypothetical protein